MIRVFNPYRLCKIRKIHHCVIFSVDFKNERKQNIANPTDAPSEESNEPFEPEKAGHIKTVFKQIFKCEFQVYIAQICFRSYFTFLIITCSCVCI